MHLPEIPEIETVCHHLRSSVLATPITGITLNRSKNLNIEPDDFIRLVTGQTIIAVGRRAKIILLTLSNQYTITIHFMLEGYAQLLEDHEPRLQQASTIFYLASGKALTLFKINLGYIHLFPTVDWQDIEDVNQLGPEPLSAEFTLSYFLKLFKSRKGMIKPLLMDQKLIAGIGNVYSNEALFCSRILPTRKVKDMNDAELSTVYHCLRRLLSQAVQLGGVYDIPYSQADQLTGGYLAQLKVAYRTGKPCFECSAPIQTQRVGGRNAFYCSKCQH